MKVDPQIAPPTCQNGSIVIVQMSVDKVAGPNLESGAFRRKFCKVGLEVVGGGLVVV